MCKDTEERGFVSFRLAPQLPLSAYCISVTSSVLIRKLLQVSPLSLSHPPFLPPFSPVLSCLSLSGGESEGERVCPLSLIDSRDLHSDSV